MLKSCHNEVKKEKSVIFNEVCFPESENCFQIHFTFTLKLQNKLKTSQTKLEPKVLRRVQEEAYWYYSSDPKSHNHGIWWVNSNNWMRIIKIEIHHLKKSCLCDSK